MTHFGQSPMTPQAEQLNKALYTIHTYKPPAAGPIGLPGLHYRMLKEAARRARKAGHPDKGPEIESLELSLGQGGLGTSVEPSFFMYGPETSRQQQRYSARMLAKLARKQETDKGWRVRLPIIK